MTLKRGEEGEGEGRDERGRAGTRNRIRLDRAPCWKKGDGTYYSRRGPSTKIGNGHLKISAQREANEFRSRRTISEESTEEGKTNLGTCE
jgi:hypothetical protein